MQQRVKNLVNGAMFAALIAVATLLLKIPLPMEKGYCNLGDGMILLSGVLPPVWAAAAAAVGSVLPDLMLGYAVYAPATALIKGVMGWMAGRWIADAPGTPQKLAFMALAECWMMGGYFLADGVLYGFPAAVASLPGNAFQAFMGILLAMLMQKPMKMLRKLMKTR